MAKIALMARGASGTTTPYGSPQEVGGGDTQQWVRPDPHDVVTRVEAELGRFATPGRVQIVGATAILVHEGVRTRAQIGEWLGRWDSLDSDARDRAATNIARQLSRSRPQSGPASSGMPRIYIDPKLIGLAVAVLAIFAYGWYASPANPGSASGAAPGADSEGTAHAPRDPKQVGPQAGDPNAQRASRTCATTLSRVLQGGTVSGADAEGWVVEVALLKEGGTEALHTHPALSKFVRSPASGTAGGQIFTWSEVPQLWTVDTSDTVVRVQPGVVEPSARKTPSASPATNTTPVPGVVLSFGGTYVDAYFSDSRRGDYHRIAHALADAVQATHGAVYAHCFDSSIHTLGSWFYGTSAKEAVTSLLYFIGTYASPLHLARPFYKPPDATDIDRRFAFENIANHAARLDRKSLATLVGAQGGMALGAPGEGVVISFPFTDGNRASRMSRTTARVLSLNR